MSLLRRGVEGVCADLGGPLRERKPAAQSRCEAGTPSGEGWAKPLPARLRSNRYVRSNPSRRRRHRKVVRPGCFGPWLRPGRQARTARPDSQPRFRRGKSNVRCPPPCRAREDCALDGAHRARDHDRHGRWRRPTRIERRSKGSPLRRSAKLFRSKSCATATI